MGSKMVLPASELIRLAKPGDWVTFLRYAGLGRDGPEYKEARGRVVMARPGMPHLVLNCGGAHGTPAIASEKNIVAIKLPKGETWEARRRAIPEGEMPGFDIAKVFPEVL